MNNLTVISKISPPAPLSDVLRRRFDFAASKVEPRGMGHSIQAEYALEDADLAAVEKRHDRLVASLAPAGEDAALMALASMQLMMLDAGVSEREADKAIELWVQNLADLPAFAIEAATADFLRGDVGERGFVPKLPVFRQRAMTKLTSVFDEKAKLGKLLDAHKHIEAPRSSPSKRAENVARAREAIREIALAGQNAEDKRSGRIIKDTPPPKPETDDERLARLEAMALEPIAPLSASARRTVGLHDVDIPDDQQQSASR